MKKLSYLLIAIVAIWILMMVIPISVSPPGDTRVITEKTYQFYVTPVCFEAAEVTNNIGETTLDRAIELGYSPDSECTVQSLEKESMSMWKALLIKMGSSNHKWNW